MRLPLFVFPFRHPTASRETRREVFFLCPIAEWRTNKTTSLVNRAAGGVFNNRCGKKAKKMEDNKKDILQKALNSIPPKDRVDLKVNGFVVREITTEEDLSVSRYPFRGMYIEVNLAADSIVRESTLRGVIEAAIDKKLSCYCSPEMVGGQKAVYRVDFEMQHVN